MNQNIKALLSRGIVAVKALEEARKGVEESVKVLATNPNTTRVLAGVFGSVTPKGLDAFVRCTEAITGIYEEVSTKVLIPASEIMAIGQELEKEAAAARKKNRRKATPEVASADVEN